MIEVSAPAAVARAEKLGAVVLDWAGTTVDFGSRAPIAAILRAFEQAGVSVTEAEARGPMGRAKRDHLKELLELPRVAEAWRAARGAAPVDADVDAVYEQFLVLQAECVVEHSAVIDGCPAAVQACRERSLRIGSSTGYTRDLLDRVARRAAGEGYEPEVRLGADDVAPGRPAPWLCVENARRLGVYPMAAVVKVDDTATGVVAGRNAGAWAVGVVASGNGVGLTADALSALEASRRDELLSAARQTLVDAGAHYLIDTIAELPDVVDRINERLTRGDSPAERDAPFTHPCACPPRSWPPRSGATSPG